MDTRDRQQIGVGANQTISYLLIYLLINFVSEDSTLHIHELGLLFTANNFFWQNSAAVRGKIVLVVRFCIILYKLMVSCRHMHILGLLAKLLEIRLVPQNKTFWELLWQHLFTSNAL